MLRVQINNLRTSKGGAPIGSVLYADSFFAGAADLGKGNDKEDAVYAPERRFCLTSSIPRLQAWFTSHEHYEHMHAPLLTEKVIRCEQLGDKTFYVPDVVGVLPLTGRDPEQLSFERDFVLKGKLVFLEKGLIFDDARLGPAPFTFDQVERVRCFIAKGFWAEFVLKEDTALPLSGFVERSFFLNLGNKFYTEHRNALTEAFGEERVEKREEECPYFASCDAL